MGLAAQTRRASQRTPQRSTTHHRPGMETTLLTQPNYAHRRPQSSGHTISRICCPDHNITLQQMWSTGAPRCHAQTPHLPNSSGHMERRGTPSGHHTRQALHHLRGSKHHPMQGQANRSQSHPLHTRTAPTCTSHPIQLHTPEDLPHDRPGRDTHGHSAHKKRV